MFSAIEQKTTNSGLIFYVFCKLLSKSAIKILSKVTVINHNLTRLEEKELVLLPLILKENVSFSTLDRFNKSPKSGTLFWQMSKGVWNCADALVCCSAAGCSVSTDTIFPAGGEQRGSRYRPVTAWLSQRCATCHLPLLLWLQKSTSSIILSEGSGDVKLRSAAPECISLMK